MFLVEGLYSFTHSVQHTHLLHSVKFLGHKKTIKFDKDTLVERIKRWCNQIVNTYIVYDLDTCQKSHLTILPEKNSLRGTTNVLKIVIKLNGFILDME